MRNLEQKNQKIIQKKHCPFDRNCPRKKLITGVPLNYQK